MRRSLALEQIDDAGGQRVFGADDGKVDFVFPGEGHQFVVGVHLDVHGLGNARHALAARRGVDFRDVG